MSTDGRKILILVFDDGAESFSVKDENDARYWFERRIEKQGRSALEGFIVDESARLPVEQWSDEYNAREVRMHVEAQEREERAQFERLKAKYEKEP